MTPAAARQEAGRLLGCEALLAPAFAYRIWPQRRGPGTTAIAAGALTLGPALEARVRTLFGEGRRLVALELDALGNERLFCLARSVLARIRREARRRGERAGDELAPGDAGLALAEQSSLLELAGAAEQGMRATARGMLSPVKSMAFLVPLGPALRTTAGGPCRRCPSRERCASRTR
jgi:hypothetical protein